MGNTQVCSRQSALRKEGGEERPRGERGRGRGRERERERERT